MKNTIVYEDTDGRIFRLKATPIFPGSAEVVIKEVVGRFVLYRATRTFSVAKFDSIAEGVMFCLRNYLAEVAREDRIAKKWREFENRG